MSVKFQENNVNYIYAQIISAVTKGLCVKYVTYQAIDMDGDLIDLVYSRQKKDSGEYKTLLINY